MNYINSFFDKKENVSHLVFAISCLVYFFHLNNINFHLFDEYHYIPAANDWLKLVVTRNVEHPPLGKLLIAFGIKFYGDNSIGWRTMGCLSGAFINVICFLLANILFKNLRLSFLLALFTMTNFWIFVQSRIGMLDIFMVLFYLSAIYYLTDYFFTEEKSKISFYLSAIFWGLAVSIKWSAVFLYVPVLLLMLYQMRMKGVKKLILFGLLSVLIYFLTFLPYLFVNGGNQYSIVDIVFKLPFVMLKMQQSVPGNHPYQSEWHTWPLMIRPIWYYFELAKNLPEFRGVLLIGNPFQMFLGIVSVLYLTFRWNKISSISKITIVLFLSSWLVWAIMPRKAFFFYYFFPSAIFYSFTTLQAILESRFKEKVYTIYLTLTLISIAFFVFFFPILSGDWASIKFQKYWFWLSTWL